jgi:hypothetical protein
VEIILLATRHQDHFAIGVIWEGGQMPLQYFSYVRIDFLATEMKRDKYKKETFSERLFEWCKGIKK